MWSLIAQPETPNQPPPEIQRVALAQGASAHSRGYLSPLGTVTGVTEQIPSPGAGHTLLLQTRAAQGQQLSGLAAGLTKLQATTWSVTQQLWETLIKSLYIVPTGPCIAEFLTELERAPI